MTAPSPTPVPWMADAPYAVPRHPAPITLRLDGNEGAPPSPRVLESLSTLTPESLQRYPSPRPLEAALARRFGLSPASVLVTAGGDEGLMRICRAFLGPGRRFGMPEPSFEMIRRYATGTGAEERSLPYPSAGYPTDEVIAACDETTAMVAVVSPNNPTGGVIAAEDLRRLSAALPQVMLMVDLAYTEFSDCDLTDTALALPNAVVFRTFSKASGLAGLRLGYAMGSERWIDVLRGAGLPYPVSSPALTLADAILDDAGSADADIAQIKTARTRITDALERAGLTVYPSQGNFVFARGTDGAWWRDAMAGLGIGIRAWPGNDALRDAIRISCPSTPSETTRLCRAIDTVAKPQAILFDMDGVLADVSRSYRVAIQQTAGRFGVEVSPSDIEAIKACGDANNDWVVTHRLVSAAGVSATLEAVTEAFETLYQGCDNADPLYAQETLIGSRASLTDLKRRYRLGIVTGRPRADAERFLTDFELSDLFDAVVCMEDAPPKPNPEPVTVAMNTLGVERAWMVGDTPDDALAARNVGVLPIGVVAPGVSKAVKTTLLHSGAAVVLEQWDQIQERLS